MNVTRTTPLTRANVNLGANTSASGQTALVAAVAGRKYRVLSLVVVSTLANVVKFQSASSDISAAFPLGANGGLVLPSNEHGWFETAANEALNVNMTVATNTGIQLEYISLPA